MLWQNTPKKVILEVIELIKLIIEWKQYIKFANEMAEKLKQIMIEIFVNGKDHEVRVASLKIVQMFLPELKTYFRKFCEIFKTTDNEAIRRSILLLLIDYASTVDNQVSLTVFELICMLIRSVDYDERYLATECLTKL